MNMLLIDVLLVFIKAQFLLSIIIFIVSLFGLFLITPDVALIMSILIWIIDLILIIGSIFILGPCYLFLFLLGNTALVIIFEILSVVFLAIRWIDINNIICS